MGHMVGLPIINFLSPHNNPINYTMCLLILAIAFLIYGYDILKNGYKNLIHKIPNMDTLVAIGVISSFAYSLYGVFMIFKGNLHYVVNLYFESSAIIIYFVKLGRYIDKISKDKTKEAIQKLVEITPNPFLILINFIIPSLFFLSEIKFINESIFILIRISEVDFFALFKYSINTSFFSKFLFKEYSNKNI